MNTQKAISSHAAAAKAIRAELKASFPTVKFSVKSESFSMGNSVHISWVDGCKTEQVEKVTNKYQYGNFNGMEDLYEMTNCREDIPQVKYVQTSRRFSEEKKMEMASKLDISWSEYESLNVVRGDYNNVIIRRALCEIDFTETPEFEAEEEVQMPTLEIEAEQSEAATPKPMPSQTFENGKNFIYVEFPQVNKNNTLQYNFEAAKEYGTNTEKCLVKKSVILSSTDYKKVSNSLLDDRPELWQEIGGSTSDDPIFENVESYEAFCVMMQNPAIRKIYRDTCHTYVVEVINEETGERFFVNTEGYNYARYTSLEYEPEAEYA